MSLAVLIFARAVRRGRGGQFSAGEPRRAFDRARMSRRSRTRWNETAGRGGGISGRTVSDADRRHAVLLAGARQWHAGARIRSRRRAGAGPGRRNSDRVFLPGFGIRVDRAGQHCRRCAVGAPGWSLRGGQGYPRSQWRSWRAAAPMPARYRRLHRRGSSPTD
jgi:hypothetical protein